MEKQIRNILSICCGDCTNKEKVKEVEDITAVLANGSALLKSSDIIYPVFGRQTATKVYGIRFIPLMRVPPGLYITRKKTQAENGKELLLNAFNLWPLIVILHVFALLAGFLVWLFESWTNREEFSRSFVHGVIDGFWWAYISMTTGDYYSFSETYSYF